MTPSSTPVPLLSVQNLTKHYEGQNRSFFGGRSLVRAVEDVSFDIIKGETLSLVGESGCGKSTVGKAIAGLHRATSGKILLNGHPLDSGTIQSRRHWHRKVQVVFQDPYASLNPRMQVRDIIAEPLKNFGLVRNAGELESAGSSISSVSPVMQVTGFRMNFRVVSANA
mgnify:CR=1 FL=1